MRPSGPIVHSSKPGVRTRLPGSALVPGNVQWDSTTSSLETSSALETPMSGEATMDATPASSVGAAGRAGGVVGGDACGVAAAPRLGVAMSELVDLVPIVRHRVRATLRHRLQG